MNGLFRFYIIDKTYSRQFYNNPIVKSKFKTKSLKNYLIYFLDGGGGFGDRCDCKKCRNSFAGCQDECKRPCDWLNPRSKIIFCFLANSKFYSQLRVKRTIIFEIKTKVQVSLAICGGYVPHESETMHTETCLLGLNKALLG